MPTNIDLITLSYKDLMMLLGVKKTTLAKMLRSGVLPVVEVARGRYVTTQAKLDKWFEDALKRGNKLNY